MTDGAPDRVTANDLVALVVELAAFALIAAWGFQASDNVLVRLLLGVGGVMVAAVAWGLWAAPKARFKVPAAALATKVAVYGAAIAAGFAVLPFGWALAFAVVALVNTVLIYVGPFKR